MMWVRCDAYPAEYRNSGVMTFIVVHDGVVPNTAAAAKSPKLQGAALATPAQPRRLEGKLEVIFRHDVKVLIYGGTLQVNA